MKIIEPKDQRIYVAVDSAIFTIKDGRLMALLIQMKKAPHTGRWAFPGGLIAQKETSEQAAKRILKDQTGVSDVYLEQLATFDDPQRDPKNRVVSVGYFALLPVSNVQIKTSDKYQDVRWWPVKQLPELAYDHKHVAKVALDRLRAKLEYSNVAYSLLPKDFTLTQLQQVYETILGSALDKRNFRRKILSLEIIKLSGKKLTGQSHRPAELYRFKDQKLVYVDIL